MAAALIVSINWCVLRIEVCCRNQPNKGSYISLYNLLLLLYQSLKQLYINDKTEHFSYEGVCGVHMYLGICK